MAYLRLFHGRRRAADGEIPSLDDWGSDGPVFGPFSHFHVTHAAEIAFGDGQELTIVDGFVHYAGVFYGDWIIVDDQTILNSPGLRALHSPFIAELAAVPTHAD